MTLFKLFGMDISMYDITSLIWHIIWDFTFFALGSSFLIIAYTFLLIGLEKRNELKARKGFWKMKTRFASERLPKMSLVESPRRDKSR